MKRLWKWLLALSLAAGLGGCAAGNPIEENSTADETETIEETIVDDSSVKDENTDLPKEGEYYYDLDNVILYLDLYGELPDNYITKEEARDLGWQGGSVEKYQEGAAIGGDRFGNREGLLPKEKGRSYTEADLDTNGKNSRGAKRLIFSNDGLYYYTDDHYETFTEYIVNDDMEVIENE